MLSTRYSILVLNQITSVSRLLSIFRRARIVISPSHDLLTNMIWSPSNTVIIEIMTYDGITPPSTRFANTAAALSFDYYYVPVTIIVIIWYH
jgi:capsular polysaccharide biosynthesis protein